MKEPLVEPSVNVSSRGPPASWASNPYALLFARLLLCERFLFEFYDKIRRFDYWRLQLSSFAVGSASSALMVFIILLLVVGVPLVVLAPNIECGKRRGQLVTGGFVCLLFFQLPATVLFESGGYEISSTVSILGGLLFSTLSGL
jgi:hypothetical protein